MCRLQFHVNNSYIHVYLWRDMYYTLSYEMYYEKCLVISMFLLIIFIFFGNLRIWLSCIDLFISEITYTSWGHWRIGTSLLVVSSIPTQGNKYLIFLFSRSLNDAMRVYLCHSPKYLCRFQNSTDIYKLYL